MALLRKAVGVASLVASCGAETQTTHSHCLTQNASRATQHPKQDIFDRLTKCLSFVRHTAQKSTVINTKILHRSVRWYVSALCPLHTKAWRFAHAWTRRTTHAVCTLSLRPAPDPRPLLSRSTCVNRTQRGDYRDKYPA